MASVLYLALFELSGLMVEFALSRRKSLTIKIWLGLVIGLMELMWLPSLYAFAFGFGLTAHYCAAATALALGVTLPVVRMIKHKPAYGKKEARPPIWLMLLLLIPLAALAANLHYTHSLREIDGALYTGQSTFGDLCMHAGFITGLIGQSYPPEYTILPGTRLGYPFLVDALSSSLYLFGMPLSLSIMIPGVLMTALIFLGFLLFSWEITRSKAASALALICLVFGGGLGFLYYLDLNGTFDLNTLGYVSAQRFSAINNAFGQYYLAPANYPKLNLRWVNALCDLIIPQRTLMAGWLCVIPALYLLYTAMKNNRRRDFVLLGLFAGPMVMIHTHSFLGLGVISLGAFIDRLIRGDKAKKDAKKENDGFEAFLVNRQPIAVNFVLYGLTAVLLALPQLLVWTFPQTFGSGTLRLLFNWVNNNEDGTLKDSWLWFWIKNVGPMFVIIPIAALVSRNRRVKALALGSLLLFILAENVVFQPNTYDNNKLFWVAYLCMLPIGAGYAVRCISAQKHLL